MDTALVSGLEFSEQQKTIFHWSEKHGWKHYPAGFGGLNEVIVFMSNDTSETALAITSGLNGIQI
jgi:hypothetical protein